MFFASNRNFTSSKPNLDHVYLENNLSGNNINSHSRNHNFQSAGVYININVLLSKSSIPKVWHVPDQTVLGSLRSYHLPFTVTTPLTLVTIGGKTGFHFPTPENIQSEYESTSNMR